MTELSDWKRIELPSLLEQSREEGRRAFRLQPRVQPWMMACFGPEVSADNIERNHRFLEESGARPVSRMHA